MEEEIRERIRLAFANDCRGPRGRPRSVRAVAKEAQVGENHLAKYLRGVTGMEVEKVARVGRILGIEISSLFGVSRQMSGDAARVPVIDAGRFPVASAKSGASPDQLQAAIAAASIGEAPNLSGDPRAFWAKMSELGVGDVAPGDWVLVCPGMAPQEGDLAGAVVGLRFVVGRYQLVREVACLVTVEGRILEDGEYDMIGKVDSHIRRNLRR